MATPVAALDRPPAKVQVTIAPVGADGIGGVAVIGPAPSGGTAVQSLTAGAPAQTFAVIHAGTCDAIDPIAVALLGDVGFGGNVQVTAPDAFEVLADGGHVVALHAGLDLTSGIGCGVIPAMAPGPDPDPVPLGLGP